MAHIVGSAKKENFGWLTCSDSLNSFVHAVGSISVYSSVHNIWHPEKLVPFATVGKTIAEEYYSCAVYT